MKHIYTVLSLLIILGVCWFSFYGNLPKISNKPVPAREFSVLRASIPLKEIAKAPHYLGSDAHAKLRKYLLSELEKLGLDPHIQEGYSYNPQAKTLNKPINIAARLKGSEDGKALLLLSHYDSAAIHSYGASDDAVGIASILESFRAYLATGAKPKNDIIILFTDAEELGLDGARLFMNEHSWAKDVGLVLNLEARGTSGPSNMILETNSGNKELIKAFSKANTPYPVTSSLMYSVYKLLPNDTDSTVFREIGDIDSFFFAFIDSHYNYHTANDNLENLNWKSFKHQGSYLLPLLHYFSDVDLDSLKSDTDYVYFNFPVFKMLYYPFSWVIPMLLASFILFTGLLIHGFQEKLLDKSILAIGFLLFLISLVFSGLIGYFGWKLIQNLYPHYSEIQQGFTYNGHTYIALFVSISMSICFGVYQLHFKKEKLASLMVAPLFFWLLINLLLVFVLKGAAFFIIPVFFALLSFYLMMQNSKPNLVVLSLLSAPALFIFAPLIQYFPVGLGLNMLVLSSIFTVLVFGLLLPVFAYYKFKKKLALGFAGFSLLLLLLSHSTSSFSVERQKPNSLVYYKDVDTEEAYWLTYDQYLDQWTQSFLGETPQKATDLIPTHSYSKYGRSYTYAAEAPSKEISDFRTEISLDSLIGDRRIINLKIIPERRIHRLELFSDSAVLFKALSFNGVEVDLTKSSQSYRGTSNSALVNYHLSEGDSLQVSFVIDKRSTINFQAMSYSYDLLEHPAFEIEARPEHTMPKPFVITDAIAIKKSFSIKRIEDNNTLR